MDVLLRMAEAAMKKASLSCSPSKAMRYVSEANARWFEAGFIKGKNDGQARVKVDVAPISQAVIQLVLDMDARAELPEAIREDAHCVDMPEEEREMFNAIAGAEEGTVRPEQITMQQMFVFGASIVVSALWVALLLKIGGWIALWLGVM